MKDKAEWGDGMNGRMMSDYFDMNDHETPACS